MSKLKTGLDETYNIQHYDVLLDFRRPRTLTVISYKVHTSPLHFIVDT